MSGKVPRRLLKKLPEGWRVTLGRVEAELVTAGMSGAEVFRLQTEPLSFLKLAEKEVAPGLRQEIARTAWLADQGIRVTPIMRTHDDDQIVAMQTQALPGKSVDVCDIPKARLLLALGRAFAKLHALPIADCPFDESLAVRLGRARQAVEDKEVDARQFNSRNRKVSPGELLARLTADRPAEEFIVAHGDATFNNMIVDSNGGVGFIDCGNAGCADRYLDLGIVAAEISDHFGRRYVNSFAEAYGALHWDPRMAAYYADLYELL
jgi:aminoglycoside 3'-phosphotransferase-2